jgi:hypothetical protein
MFSSFVHEEGLEATTMVVMANVPYTLAMQALGLCALSTSKVQEENQNWIKVGLQQGLVIEKPPKIVIENHFQNIKIVIENHFQNIESEN